MRLSGEESGETKEQNQYEPWVDSILNVRGADQHAAKDAVISFRCPSAVKNDIKRICDRGGVPLQALMLNLSVYFVNCYGEARPDG